MSVKQPQFSTYIDKVSAMCIGKVSVIYIGKVSVMYTR